MGIALLRLSVAKMVLAKPVLPQQPNNFLIKQNRCTLQCGGKKKEYGCISMKKRHGIYPKQCLKMQSTAPSFIGCRDLVRTPATSWVTCDSPLAHPIPATKYLLKING